MYSSFQGSAKEQILNVIIMEQNVYTKQSAKDRLYYVQQNLSLPA